MSESQLLSLQVAGAAGRIARADVARFINIVFVIVIVFNIVSFQVHAFKPDF